MAALSATGPAVVGRSLSNGDTPEQAMAKGSVASARAASRLALSGGRRTITESVRVDRRALGVIRTTSASPCHFCAMLAARGPVYQSERVAKFDAHDGCNCNAEPVYDRDTQWPGRAREWAELYDRTARGEPNPINAFRRAFTAPAG